MSIKRLYVEKKEGCDIEAVSLFNDIKTNLNVYGLNKIRVLVRYDVEGISDEDFETAKTTIFSEPPVDMIYEESYDFGMNRVFAVEYLPGQYDQRADSAMQCVQIISQKEQPTIALAKGCCDEFSIEAASVNSSSSLICNASICVTCGFP